MVRRERFVVVFDSVGDPQAFVRVATDLARAADAELHGIFLEETETLNMAELPFTSIVDDTGRVSPLGKDTLEAAWRAAASRARQRLNRAADDARLPWAFHVMRGRLASALEEAQGARATLVAPPATVERERSAAALVLASRSDIADQLEQRARLLLGPQARVSRGLVDAASEGTTSTVASMLRLCAASEPPFLIVSAADPCLAGSGLGALRRQSRVPILLFDS